MSSIALTNAPAERRDALSERLFELGVGALDLFSVHLGDRLGYYQVLRSFGPLTAKELAERTGTLERYCREWLEHQAVAGIVEVENPHDPAPARRFFLPAGHDEVMADPESLHYMAPLAQLIAGAVRPIDEVLEAYREGRGVPFERYGRDMVEGQGRMNRAMFLRQLGQEWIPAMPDVHSRLLGRTARVADIGCGVGWSSIGVAQSYPNARVDGFDFDTASVLAARRNAREAGVADRVSFWIRDAGDDSLAGRYDLVMALECLHDMSNPVAALRAMRRLAAPGGGILIADERNADTFTPAADPAERLQYGFSVLHCLPAGMSEQPSAATGTVMRLDTVRGYAFEAGYSHVEVLPIDNFMFRFYRLHP